MATDGCRDASSVTTLFDMKDTDPKKVSLGVGAYRDDKGKVGRMQKDAVRGGFMAVKGGD